MKKKRSFSKLFGRRSVILAAVSLLLVSMLAVGMTVSWIEDVSQVEFNSNEGQATPLHVGNKSLNSDMKIKKDNTTGIISLSDYFNKSGDMHLSPCYGDGENFYFPVERPTDSPVKYRTGTKDDANVNYLSATFRVKSENAATAYWFEKTNSSTNYVTFKKGTASQSDSALQQRLRCSITVDGATNVYAFNSSGYYYLPGSTSSYSVSQKTGRRFDQYTYYSESFNSSTKLPNTSTNSGYANQGGGNNLNGNTLFSVPTYDSSNNSTVKTVTVKIWLECKSATIGSNVSAADIASLNINLVSSWAKTRRVFVKDATIHQDQRTQAKWLSHNGTSDNTAGLFWAIKGQESTLNWKLTRVSTTSDYYYVDIPAVYNNVDAVLSRRSGTTTWAATTEWDKWETTFPDTFHSETYTVYSTDFGTWESADKVHCVYFVNSAFFTNVYDYMWDHNSEHGTGINDKVVKNADWPGLKMTTKMAAKTSSQNLDTYAFFYNSDYDRIIFNDGKVASNVNHEYQTQNLWLTDSSGNPLSGVVNCTFDMATLTWFNTSPSQSSWSGTSVMPNYSASNTYMYTNMATDNTWNKTRFAYGGALSGTSSSKQICKFYNKSANSTSDYEMKLCLNGTWYGAYSDSDHRLYNGNSYTLGSDNNHQDNLILEDLAPKSVYRFTLEWDNGNPKITMNKE